MKRKEAGEEVGQVLEPSPLQPVADPCWRRGKVCGGWSGREELLWTNCSPQLFVLLWEVAGGRDGGEDVKLSLGKRTVE